MPEPDDNTLLREYVENDSEQAFAALVARHVDKVYSVALRQTRNPLQAEEITQVVFVILARKARSLSKRVILSGWLYQAARLTAVTFVRSEIRRFQREKEAQMQTLSSENETDVWTQMAPLLETAMAQLNETDRLAVVLRFFDGKSIREVGTELGLNEEAAKKRVGRALEKLRRFFANRGMATTTAILSGAISAHAVQAAPATLAKSATAAALAKGVAASSSTLTLIKGALRFMAWTKAKTAVLAGVAILFATGTTTVAVREIAAHRTPEWQKRFDLTLLDGVSPQVRILPSLPGTVQSNLHKSGERNGKVLELGESVTNILIQAYNVLPSRLIVNTPLPEGEYDFIDTYLKGPDKMKGLQVEVKKTLGLAGRRAMIETNVLLLTVQSPNATGFKASTSAASYHTEPGSYSLHGGTLYGFVADLEDILGVVVIDETRLRGKFDIDFKWDSTPEGLKRALNDQLGLRLTPSRKVVEYTAIEKAR
ncbi:MAG TPA: sigma-70 family RNA polymerase sigma factor [Verrucomicrobiae bacterium]|nr:sigma-70 family RNA polymerase sigma factor [Verrucomicrobiae bacterium]